MLGTCGISSDERQRNCGRRSRRQLDLSLLSSFLQSLHSQLVSCEVNALSSLELSYHPVDDPLVEVIAAQLVVTCCCKNFCNAVAHFDDRYIEGTAAQVVYHYLLILFLIDTVRKCSSGRLVDDSLNSQTCDLTCILCCLSLSISEVSGDCDNSLSYLFTQISLSVSLQLLEYHSGDLLRSILLAAHACLIIRTHVSLDRDNGVLIVGYCLSLSYLTYKSVACLGKTYNGRSSSCTLTVGDYYCFAAFHNCYT